MLLLIEEYWAFGLAAIAAGGIVGWWILARRGQPVADTVEAEVE